MRIPDINVIALIGQTLTAVTNSGDEVTFETASGKRYHLYHDQDCCECVQVTDVRGDLATLTGAPVTRADESIESGEAEYGDHWTRTTFTLATKTSAPVVIEWLGTSNGYYSEHVSFGEVQP